MVESSLSLNSIFSSLADPTRRDILRRVSKKDLSIGQIARFYKLTFAAISKHLQVLEKAKLIIKHRKGKEQVVSISAETLKDADHYLHHFKDMWEARFDRLDKLLIAEKKKLKNN
jgi:DNA-binding transcriptional ArsR family regulator